MKIEEEIVRMRKKGMKISEIASRLGKSIYFVYSRLNKDYYPVKMRREK
jgi:transposase